jgi:hypothetical protein
VSRLRTLSSGVLGLALLGVGPRAEGASRTKAVAVRKPTPEVAKTPLPSRPVAQKPQKKLPAATPTPATRRPTKPAAATAKPTANAAKPTANAAKPAPSLAKSAQAPAAKPRENAYLEIPERAFSESTLAFRYANLSDQDALDELARRGIAWAPATPPLPGVRTPIRLTAPLRGVAIHSTLPPAQRAETPFEILDARLALALYDFCAVLARHDVVELVHYTMYRAPAEPPLDGQRQIRHPAGLAIDVGALRKRDGSWLAVGPHWPSNIGAKTCGEGAVEHFAREARELASIVCEATDERIFHFALTPDFDAAHADHVHLEIKPATRWFIVN